MRLAPLSAGKFALIGNGLHLLPTPALTRPVRVIQLLPTLQRRGIEKVVRDIALALNGNGFEIDVCCEKTMGPLENILIENRIGVFCLKEKSPRDMAAALRLLSVLRHGRYDIAHLHCAPATSYLIPVLRLARVPRVICTIHGLPSLPSPPAAHAKVLIGSFLAGLVSGSVDWTYACSEAALSSHRRLGLKSRGSSVVYNGIDLEEFSSGTDKAAAKAALGLPSDKTVIGAVGSLCAEKGHEHLIRAFASIRDRLPDASLLLVGSGPDEKLLARLAQALGCGERVHFVAERADIAECVHAMDVFAFPSLSEGFGLALAEAMACGVPVVASAVGGVPELVTDGLSGLLVPAGSSEALAGAILRLIENPDVAGGLARTALRRVTESFSVKRMTNQVRDLYTGLLPNRQQFRALTQRGEFRESKI